MALGTPVGGSEFRVSVAPATTADAGITFTAGTYVPLGRSYNFGHNQASNVTSQGTYEGESFDFSSPTQKTYDVTGMLAAGDTGQETVRAAYAGTAATAYVFLKILPNNGTGGYTVRCGVASINHSAPLQGPQTMQYSFTQKAAPTIIGTSFPDLAS